MLPSYSRSHKEYTDFVSSQKCPLPARHLWVRQALFLCDLTIVRSSRAIARDHDVFYLQHVRTTSMGTRRYLSFNACHGTLWYYFLWSLGNQDERRTILRYYFRFSSRECTRSWYILWFYWQNTRKALRCSELPLRPTTGASLVLRRAIAPRLESPI